MSDNDPDGPIDGPCPECNSMVVLREVTVVERVQTDNFGRIFDAETKEYVEEHQYRCPTCSHRWKPEGDV